MLLKERTAIVYGASGAVGGAVARAFAREGARVVLAARRRAPLEEAAADIRSRDGLAEVMPVDATDPQAVEEHLQAVAERWGPVSLMFNAVSWDDVQGEVLAALPFDAVFCADPDGADDVVLHGDGPGQAHGAARRRHDSGDHGQCGA